MKINQIRSNYNRPSFGLKISQNAGFRELMEKTRGINWKCSEEEIQDFVTKLEDMHFSQESKDNTSIIFSPAIKKFVGYRTFPSYTAGRKFVNEPCYVAVMPYAFYKTGTDAPKVANYVVQLNNSSLDDILVNIASNYAEYFYSNL